MDQIFGLFFTTAKKCIDFDKKMGQDAYRALLSKTHLVTLHETARYGFCLCQESSHLQARALKNSLCSS
jgi:hypothetical protein